MDHAIAQPLPLKLRHGGDVEADRLLLVDRRMGDGVGVALLRLRKGDLQGRLQGGKGIDCGVVEVGRHANLGPRFQPEGNCEQQENEG